jgi:DNA-binding XRE family transcriptional regulator
MKKRDPKFIGLLQAFWKTGLTQYQFAQNVGLSSSVFSQILNGRIHPREDEKSKIAKGLGAEVEEIFSDNS